VFNSPTAFCPRCREYIALDERRRDCAAVHCCGDGCPMERYFGEAKITGRRSGDEAQSGNERVAGGSAAREG
jgi:sulfatase maturation enzyme AslB (radical SAM superfamily)